MNAAQKRTPHVGPGFGGSNPSPWARLRGRRSASTAGIHIKRRDGRLANHARGNIFSIPRRLARCLGGIPRTLQHPSDLAALGHTPRPAPGRSGHT
eukprot:5921344-Pyramimonas_sp.AAC.1